MNDHLHPIREAVASFSPIDADKIKVGGTLLEPANEGDLTEADLEAIDREYEIAKSANRYDSRREEAAAKLERDSALFRAPR